MNELDIYGLGSRTPVRLTGRTDELLGAFEQAWSRCLAPLDAVAGPDVVVTDAVSAHLGTLEADDDTADLAMTDLATLLSTLTQRITAAKIRSQAGRLFMVHAGAVAHPDSGDAVAFVAPGGTGKTTLMSQLSEAYCYLTDETVGVTFDGEILPYPKPLSLRQEAGSPKLELSPDAGGFRPTPPRARLRRLVLLARTEGHGDAPPAVEELTEFEAISALAPETSSLAALPRPLHALADLLDSLDPIVRLHYRDAETLTELVASWLAKP